MNSTYGKLAWAREHNVSNRITGDTDFILSEFAKGNITNVEQLNKNYYIYSGVDESQTKHTNFMVAAYITARARL